MNPRAKKFLSYYKPYRNVFFADMLCAFAVAAISLILPMIVRYITNTVLVNNGINEAIGEIAKLAAVMVLLAILQFFCNFFAEIFAQSRECA